MGTVDKDKWHFWGGCLEEVTFEWIHSLRKIGGWVKGTHGAERRR